MNVLLRFNATVVVFVMTHIIGCSSNEQTIKPEESNTTFYIDAVAGNDDNTGSSPEEAFASLEKINSMWLEGGTQVLFKSGTSYSGQLKPRGVGQVNNPIIISKYGGEEKPQINGKGKYTATVHIYNMAYVELIDLEITNTGSERQNGRRGVFVEAEDCGEVNHVILDNLFIHDVNGSLVKSSGGGSAILWRNHGEQIKTKFDSLIIQNCYIKDCGRNGINAKGYTQRDNWYPSTHVIIRNNLLEGVPGDGIVPIGTDGALIEYNVMRDCPDILSHTEAAAGIWPWSADNTLIQYNEVSGHKAKWDGQGFDSDFNCLNTIIQYNYSHDNYGGFLLVCNSGSSYNSSNNIGTYHTIVRYNISVNDGIRPYETERRGWFSPVMHITGPVEETLIHHNLFIFPAKKLDTIDKTFIQMDNWGGPWPNKTLVANNCMDFTNSYTMVYGESQQTFMVDNVYDPTKLELQIQEQIPVWAQDYDESCDPAWKDILIETFFEENEVMRQQIESMVK